MKIKTPLLPHFLLLLALLVFPCARLDAQKANVPARITQALDEENLVTLKGNVHPLARAEFDQGAVSDGQPLHRMLLLLQRGADQEAALQQLLDEQQNKSSANYHAWLTPAQFGQQFGPADADIQTVTSWLQSHGFQVTNVSAGRTTIEFSGSAAQVRSAFHSEIHKYLVNGETRMANASDPQILAALAPVVAGPVSLNNFPRKSYARILGQFRRTIGKPGLEPLFTFPDPFTGAAFYGLGPGDFATIYNSKPLIASGNDGTGQTIAIVGETNINVQDVQQFRQMFALPANFSAANIILNGEDPGITSKGEEGEADLDVEWSGAVAPGATVKFVVSASTPASAGIDLSALYIVEQNLAGAMSESYGQCEQGLGAAGNAFYNLLWEQAAAQGITVILSAGDGGSAGCDDFDSEQVATLGLAVSGLASTPFNVSVGGTDFDQVDNWSSFWSATNDATGSSAISYIPEIPWNQNCAQISLTGCGSSAPQGSVNIVAGSGGPSAVYTKPKWQMGVAGMPNDNHRDQPDISLFASPGFDGTGYVYCQSDQTISQLPQCDLNATNGVLDFGIVGGTSASAPAFAGIMALVNQYEANHGGTNRQGNANYVLYALAKKAGASCASAKSEASGCVFNDVVKGNSRLPTGAAGVGTNSVPCQRHGKLQFQHGQLEWCACRSQPRNDGSMDRNRGL
jgi:subtilase family serine protease